jgi:hypothetical protein
MTKSYTDWVAAGMCLIDKARANAGRIRRTPYNELNTSSYYKASDISVCEPDPNDSYAVHHACGRPIDYWFKWSNPGACYQTAFAENVYIGYGSASTAREAVSWWLHSDAHRSALLSPDYWGHYLNYSGPTTYRGTPNTRIWVYHMARCYTYTTGG